MSYGIYNSAAFVTASGVAVAPNADVEVRRESDSALADIKSDRAGATPIAQPGFQADALGRFEFYAAGISGGYQVKVTKGAETQTVRYQAVGTAKELDADPFWASVWAAATQAAARLALGFAAVGAAGTILMARASAAMAWVAALNKSIYGLTYDVGTDTVNDININTGGAMDETGAYWMTLATALGKQSDVLWAVGGTPGAPAGFLDTGTVGNSDYYVWLIARSDTGVVDAICSLSSTTPDMTRPGASYDFKRLIGWFKRVGGTVVAFTTYETEGGGLELLWTSPTLDINLANTLTTTRRTDAVKVPLNLSVVANLNLWIEDANAGVIAYVYCPDAADQAASISAAPLMSQRIEVAASGVGWNAKIRTSSTGTIAAISNTATVNNYFVSTLGLKWARRN